MSIFVLQFLPWILISVNEYLRIKEKIKPSTYKLNGKIMFWLNIILLLVFASAIFPMFYEIGKKDMAILFLFVVYYGAVIIPLVGGVILVLLSLFQWKRKL